MTLEEYNNKRRQLVTRLFDAAKAKCHRTVNARKRDLAKLKSEYEGITFIDALKIIDSLYKSENKHTEP